MSTLSSSSATAVKLVHHGAAATSSAKVLTWLPPLSSSTANDEPTTSTDSSPSMVYASHAMINIAKPVTVQLHQATTTTAKAAAAAGGTEASGTSDTTTTSNTSTVWKVHETLRTDHSYSTGPTESAPTITTLTRLKVMGSSSATDDSRSNTVPAVPTLACGFSNGTVTVWNQNQHQNQKTCSTEEEWNETVVVDAIAMKQQQQPSVPVEQQPRSLTDLKGVVWKTTTHDNYSLVLLAACSSAGVTCYSYDAASGNNESTTAITTITTTPITHQTAFALQWESLSEDTLLLLVGTAAPRHNKVMVYTVTMPTSVTPTSTMAPTFQLWGSLTGHEDWITCFAWQPLLQNSSSNNNNNNNNTNNDIMMASGSQDFKIRLWKLTTSTTSGTTTNADGSLVPENDDRDNDDDELNIEKDEEDYEEHESRMEILWQSRNSNIKGGSSDAQQMQMQTSVSLEALLLGHENPVTAIQWYNPTYDNDNDNDNATANPEGDQEPLVLLSSSMDRSILLWSPSEDDGIWTPISRVGSAGGILGGSIGSTLLGYVNVQTMMNSNSNNNTHWMVGHAYGGALHMWCKDDVYQQNWKATPCVTGHFDGVTDLCWESTFGSYLLTVSVDQTCRLWAPVETVADDNNNNADNNNDEVTPASTDSSVWVEVARPQVHGYDLSAVTSLSSHSHRHWLVSGADEKELRILDAPMTTLRMLQSIQPDTSSSDALSPQNDNPSTIITDSTDRVERAYIPSLGLSNKATAVDGAEEDVQDADDAQQKTVTLPSERDLGALSLWLETRKLFGHNTELYRLTSTLEAKTAFDGNSNDSSKDDESQVLVASAAKARDIEAAAILIWNPNSGECLQTLTGGHKSTVATLSFSPDGGNYLASSGKDRRLCLWRRRGPSAGDGQPLYSLAAAKDTAHKRIIWSVHFCPYDSSILASGSRDGSIKIWKITDAEDGVSVSMDQWFSFAPATLSPAKKPDAITALAFAPQPLPQNNCALLALGFECGLIELWSVPTSKEDSTVPELAPKLLYCFASNLCHVATVTKLAWKPLRSEINEHLVLASASADRGCRIFDIVPAELGAYEL